MGIKFQKLVIYITLIILTVIFLYLFIAVDREIEGIKHRNQGFLTNLIINEMKQAQSEFMGIFEVYLEKSRNIENDKQNFITEIQSLELEYINYIGFISVDKSFEYYTIYQKGYNPSIDLEDMINKINLYNPNEYISSNKKYGYLFFPILDNQNNIKEWLFISVSIERLIEDNLKNLSDSLLEEGYQLETKLGKNLNLSLIKKSSVIFDLDEIFTIKNRRDFLRRIDIVHLDNEIFNDNNKKYLIISHMLGSTEYMFNMKRNIYFIGIIIIYIAIVSLILYIHLAHINLKKSNEREKEFTALISHELKTPLSVILLGGENLQSGVVQDVKGIEYYGGLIVNEASKLKKMIESILSISTMNYNNDSAILHCESSVSMVEEALDNLSMTIETNSITINKNYNNLNESIYCHRTSIISCLQNVIENGIIYGASKSSSKILDITIKEIKKGKKLGIGFIIQDSGPGIPKSESSSIFKSFHRAKSSIDQQIPGSGLGLSISRKILTKFGGSLTLYDSLKKGSTFEIWIPKLDKI